MKNFTKLAVLIIALAACDQPGEMVATHEIAPQNQVVQRPLSDVRPDLDGLIYFEDKYCRGVTQNIVRCFGLLEPGTEGYVPVTLERDGEVIAFIGEFPAIGKAGGGQTTYAPSFQGENGRVMWVTLEDRATINVRGPAGDVTTVRLDGVENAYHGVRLTGGEFVTRNGRFSLDGLPIN